MYEAVAPVWIDNMTDIQQSVFYKGKRHELAPYGQMPVEAELAQAFVTANPTTVKLLDERQAPTIAGEPMHWVANMTGNPDEPGSITVQRFDPKEERSINKEIPNPKAVPMLVTEWIRPGQTYEEDPNEQGNMIAINATPQPVIIPPYKRVPLSATVAERVVTRDASRPNEAVGSIRYCRAPSGFEPNETWELDDIRAYARLLGPSARLSDKELNIKQSDKYNNDHAARQNAKTKLLNALFFRLVDDRFRLPDKAEFDAFIAEGTHKKGN